MERRAGGWYVAALPAQPANTLVAFHIEAEDGGLPAATTVVPSGAPSREALIRWGSTNAPGTFATYHLWITESTRQTWTTRDKNSNHPLQGSFVYHGERVIHSAKCMCSGSPIHARKFNGPTGSQWCDYSLEMPKNDRLLNATDVRLQMLSDDDTRLRQQLGYWAAERLGVPYLHRRYHHLFVNGVRRTPLSEYVQQPAGDVVEEFYPNDDRAPCTRSKTGSSFWTTASASRTSTPRWATFAPPMARARSPATVGTGGRARFAARRTTSRSFLGWWTP